MMTGALKQLGNSVNGASKLRTKRGLKLRFATPTAKLAENREMFKDAAPYFWARTEQRL